MMDLIDSFELAHGIYPVAFDRRWHCGVHLMPSMHETVHAIADGVLVAFRVCQRAYPAHGGEPDSNPGFVLLRHATETGDGRTLTFYSFYMHLLDLASYQSIGADAKLLPEFLRMPAAGDDIIVPPAQPGAGRKVRRKDVLGWTGACNGQRHLHFEIFMTKADFDAYFGHTQLGHPRATQPEGTDCWGHSYYVIPAGRAFRSLPPGTDAQHRLHGIGFEPGHGGQNTQPLHVEVYFHKGSKYTNVWSVGNEGNRTLLTADPVVERDYEYDLYRRATALYPACPSDGYELLRFGRILSAPQTLPEAACATWMRVTFAPGQQGYIDISDREILKLSDADFPQFMGWQKISEGAGLFNADRMCDIDVLKKILKDSAAHQTPKEFALTGEYQKEDALVRYVKTTEGVRSQLRGFVCEAPGEWDGTHNEERYRKLKEEGEFYHGNEAGYTQFIRLLESFQFWEQTGLPAGEKLWFFHPLQFIRHFRKCGWLSASELARCLPRSSLSVNLSWSSAEERALAHHRFVSRINVKYLNSSPVRLLHFLSQAYIETGGLRTMREDSRGGGHAYGPFYGRGYLQLTWPINYEGYGNYRHVPLHGSPSYIDPRITLASTHEWADGASVKRWVPLYDPEIIATDLIHAAESSGMYWVAKSFRKTNNMNRAADLGTSPAVVGFISWLVNGGGNGYIDRQQFSVLLGHVLLDTVHYVSHEVWRYPPLSPLSNPALCRTFPPATVPFSQSIIINHVPQVP